MRRSSRRIRSAAEAYIQWLMLERGYSRADAILHATGKPIPNPAPPPQNDSEHAAAREADKPADVRRWARIAADCPRKGCQLPVNHSGPHQLASKLDEMLRNSIDELDRREGK